MVTMKGSDASDPFKAYDLEKRSVENSSPAASARHVIEGRCTLPLPGAFCIYPKGVLVPDHEEHSKSSYRDDNESNPLPPPLLTVESTLVDEEAQSHLLQRAIREAVAMGRQDGLMELASTAVLAVPVTAASSVHNGQQQQLHAKVGDGKRTSHFAWMVLGLAVVVVAIVVTAVKVKDTRASHSSPLSAPSPVAKPVACFENHTVLLDAVDAYLQSPNNTYSLTHGLSITSWCVSTIEVFDFLFSSDRNPAADHFDADLSGWDVSNATSMAGMFTNSRRFKGIGLENWDVGSVTNMSSMFERAWSFDGNLSGWNVSRVTTMQNMFSDAAQFRGIGLDQWNVSQSQDMSGMFQLATLLDADLSSWDVSKVENTHAMFANATSLRGTGLQQWNVSCVQDMAGMFFGASSFSANLSSWDVSHVKNLSWAFADTIDFDGAGLDQWDTSLVVDMTGLFWGASALDTNLSRWDVSRVTTTQYMFSQAASFRGIGLDVWDISSVVDLSGMFWGASLFEANLSGWDVSHVATLRNMLNGASLFTGMGLHRWDTSRVQDMYQTFYDACVFDVDLSDWNVSKVISMEGMFCNASQFRGVGLERWDVSRVQDFSCMFFGASLFDGNLSKWDVSQATSLVNMFRDSTSFRGIGGLDNWNVSQSDALYNMFRNASNFLGTGVDKWDVSNAQDMYKMFCGASSFDANLSGWDVSYVVDMSFVFADAVSFTGTGLDAWNPSHAIDTSELFHGAILFKTNLCDWGPRLRPHVNTTAMFIDTACLFTESPSMNLTPPGPFCYQCKSNLGK